MSHIELNEMHPIVDVVDVDKLMKICEDLQSIRHGYYCTNALDCQYPCCEMFKAWIIHSLHCSNVSMCAPTCQAVYLVLQHMRDCGKDNSCLICFPRDYYDLLLESSLHVQVPHEISKTKYIQPSALNEFTRRLLGGLPLIETVHASSHVVPTFKSDRRFDGSSIAAVYGAQQVQNHPASHGDSETTEVKRGQNGEHVTLMFTQPRTANEIAMGIAHPSHAAPPQSAQPNQCHVSPSGVQMNEIHHPQHMNQAQGIGEEEYAPHPNLYQEVHAPGRNIRVQHSGALGNQLKQAQLPMMHGRNMGMYQQTYAVPTQSGDEPNEELMLAHPRNTQGRGLGMYQPSHAPPPPSTLPKHGQAYTSGTQMNQIQQLQPPDQYLPNLAANPTPPNQYQGLGRAERPIDEQQKGAGILPMQAQNHNPNERGMAKSQTSHAAPPQSRDEAKTLEQMMDEHIPTTHVSALGMYQQPRAPNPPRTLPIQCHASSMGSQMIQTQHPQHLNQAPRIGKTAYAPHPNQYRDGHTLGQPIHMQQSGASGNQLHQAQILNTHGGGMAMYQPVHGIASPSVQANQYHAPTSGAHIRHPVHTTQQKQYHELQIPKRYINVQQTVTDIPVKQYQMTNTHERLNAEYQQSPAVAPPSEEQSNMQHLMQWPNAHGRTPTGKTNECQASTYVAPIIQLPPRQPERTTPMQQNAPAKRNQQPQQFNALDKAVKLNHPISAVNQLLKRKPQPAQQQDVKHYVTSPGNQIGHQFQQTQSHNPQYQAFAMHQGVPGCAPVPEPQIHQNIVSADQVNRQQQLQMQQHPQAMQMQDMPSAIHAHQVNQELQLQGMQMQNTPSTSHAHIGSSKQTRPTVSAKHCKQSQADPQRKKTKPLPMTSTAGEFGQFKVPMVPPLPPPAAPARKLADPARKLAAPARKLAAPARKLAAPARKLAAPARKLAAPARKLATINERFGSTPVSTKASSCVQLIQRLMEPLADKAHSGQAQQRSQLRAATNTSKRRLPPIQSCLPKQRRTQPPRPSSAPVSSVQSEDVSLFRNEETQTGSGNRTERVDRLGLTWRLRDNAIRNIIGETLHRHIYENYFDQLYTITQNVELKIHSVATSHADYMDRIMTLIEGGRTTSFMKSIFVNALARVEGDLIPKIFRASAGTQPNADSVPMPNVSTSATPTADSVPISRASTSTQPTNAGVEYVQSTTSPSV